MTSGGARSRSGPQPDLNSGRTASRGLTFRRLPAEGYAGEAPIFPLPRTTRFDEYFEDGKKIRTLDEGATEKFRERELAIWLEHWTYPQADAWASEPHRWPTIAEFCRLKTVVESEPDASAALMAQMHRYRDQIGLTPAGLKENGWQIASTEAAEAEEPQQSGRTSARERRLSLVKDDNGAA